jgi:hypothetical protein
MLLSLTYVDSEALHAIDGSTSFRVTDVRCTGRATVDSDRTLT